MFIKLKRAFVLALFTIMALSLFSCDDETAAVMTLLGGTEKDGVHSVSVSHLAETVDLGEYIVVSEDAKWTAYADAELEQKIEGVVALNTGANTFYVRVKEGSTKKVYTIEITRKKAITISFDTAGGSECHQIVVDEGTIVGAPQTVRSGYDFVGWDVDFSAPITEDITAKAKWEAKSFKLVVDGVEQVVKFGENYSVTAIDKLGYTFDKLVDSDGKEFPLSGKWDKLADVTVTSAYIKENYKITFIFNANIDNKTQTYTIEDKLVFEAPTHPDGLEFDAWYSDSALKNKVTGIEKGTTGNKTFYAGWKIEIEPEEVEYTITIDADKYDFDGSTIIVKYGESYSLPEVPEKAGYEFVAWMYGETIIPTAGKWAIRDNVTLTIKLNKVKFNITYVVDDKTTNTNTTTEFTIEDSVELTSPTRPNAVFVGWFTSPTFEEETKLSLIDVGTVKDVTLYAKFDITTHTLTYVANGGTVAKDSFTYEKGDKIELLTPERKGYKFDGWYNGDSLFESTEWTFDENIQLKAKWTRELYLVEYNVNGGTTTETLKQAYSVEDTFTLPTLSKEGYYFLGWSEEGSKNVYQTLTVQKGTTGNKKYVAKWSEFSYSFTENGAIVTSYKFVKSRAWVRIPSTINHNGVDYPVIEIGSNVFSGMGPKIDESRMTKFEVEIPTTLKKIGLNAFYNCNDVCINVKATDLVAFADSLEVAEGNDHVVDVIKGRRPAIGWSIYG